MKDGETVCAHMNNPIDCNMCRQARTNSQVNCDVRERKTGRKCYLPAGHTGYHVSAIEFSNTEQHTNPCPRCGSTKIHKTCNKDALG